MRLSSLLDSVLHLRWSLPSSTFFSGSFFTDFVGSVPGVFLLRLVCALQLFLHCASALSPRPCTLLVSPRCPSHSLSPTTLSFLLGCVILQSFPTPTPSSLPSSASSSASGPATSFLWVLCSSSRLQGFFFGSGSVCGCSCIIEFL